MNDVIVEMQVSRKSLKEAINHRILLKDFAWREVINL
jgi:hypothetical protein